MGTYTMLVCDGCGVKLPSQQAGMWRRVAASDRSADVCSLACAQAWIAAFFEDMGRLQARNPIAFPLLPMGD